VPVVPMLQRSATRTALLLKVHDRASPIHYVSTSTSAVRLAVALLTAQSHVTTPPDESPVTPLPLTLVLFQQPPDPSRVLATAPLLKLKANRHANSMCFFTRSW
jgi:hypothetical protein